MNRLLKDLEFKVYTTSIEKAGHSGERRLIRGYASVGDVLDRQNEVITLGALVKAREDLLKNHTIFYEHKHSELPIGKTISVDIDERGLLITVEISKGSHADSVWTLIQEGILNSFSIGGRVLEAEEKRDKDGNLFNEITQIELFETSVVGLPANPAAKFELISKSFGMAITEEMRKREVSYMAQEKEKVEKTENLSSTTDNVSFSENIGASETITSDESKAEVTIEKTETNKEATKEKEVVEKSEENKEEVTKKAEKSEEAKEEVSKKEETPKEELQKDHSNNATDEVNDHWHEVAVDAEGNGETTTIVTKEGYSGDANHKHDVVDGVVEESDGHPHALIAPIETSVDTETDKSEEQPKEKIKETTPVEENSSEESPEEKPVEEKSIDELILEKLGQILENQKKKTEKSEEVPESKEEEVEVGKSEEAPAEEVKTEAPAEKEEVAVAKSDETSEKAEEKDLEKVVKIEDTPKDSNKLYL